MQELTTILLQQGLSRPQQDNQISPTLIEIKEESVEELAGFACPECRSKGTGDLFFTEHSATGGLDGQE